MGQDKELIPEQARGFILAVSAPSGTGKTSLCDKLAAEYAHVVRSISVTTRPQRPGEVSGKDYLFVSIEDFRQREARGELLETAEVFGNWYGTPKAPVEQALSRGQVIVMDIDTVGALRIHSLMPRDTVLLFIVPPSFKTLEERLRKRGKNEQADLDRRLTEAQREVRESPKYHYLICNESFDVAYRELIAIVEAERLKSARQQMPFLA